MVIRDLFDKQGLEESIDRINQLTPESKALWGKMNVSQMLAHLSVAYTFFYDKENLKAPNPLAKFFIKLLAKNQVVGSKPYPRNGRTAPQFIIEGDRDFEKEKAELIAYMNKTYELGRDHFDGAESLSFGALSADEWNMLYSKHLDHHLTQFGV